VAVARLFCTYTNPVVTFPRYFFTVKQWQSKGRSAIAQKMKRLTCELAEYRELPTRRRRRLCFMR